MPHLEELTLYCILFFFFLLFSSCLLSSFFKSLSDMKTMYELTIDSSTLKALTISHCSPLSVLNVHSHSLREITLERNAWLQDLSLRCPDLLSLSMPSCTVCSPLCPSSSSSLLLSHLSIATRGPRTSRGVI